MNQVLDLVIERSGERLLKRVSVWIGEWEENGAPLLHDGDFPGALEQLVAADDFESGLFPEVDRAQSQRGAVEAAIDAIESTAVSLQAVGADPALAVLVEWAGALERTPSKKALKELDDVLDSKASKAWASAAKALNRYEKRANKPFAERAPQLVADLAALEGRFVEELHADLAAAADDEAAFNELAASAEARPRLWLARDYFGW